MADLGNSAVLSQVDASNGSGTMPSWLGSAAPSTLDDAGRALQGAVTREWNWRNYTLTAGGTADAKTLTFSVAPAAYYNGQRFAFIANTVNTTTATLNVNSLGATTIKKVVAGALTNLAAGDMVAGMFVEVAYNTANTCFVWVNQGNALTSSTNTFTAGQTISAGGLTVSGGDTLVTGSGGLGYGTGSGGTVTQLTSKATGVTLNKTNGKITMNNAALAASTTVGFVFTNSTISASDAIIIHPSGGNSGLGTYNVWADNLASGSCVVWVRNISGVSQSEALTLNFAVIKAVTA